MVFSQSRRSISGRMIRHLRLLITCSALALVAMPAEAQISFTTAVDLALKNSPKVLMAKAEVDKAIAALSETRDIYIPTLVGGSGLGFSYGFPVGQPSVFNVTSQSLIFNYSQMDYLRAARAALDAANLALKDARMAVTEDAAITYVALDRDIRRQEALNDEARYAGRLVNIVQYRLDAGQDTPIELTTAQLSVAQIRLARLRADDETTVDRAHLARLTGLPARGLDVVSSSIPQFAAPASDDASDAALPNSPAVDSAYASAHAKREIAFGDARYLWRPQIFFAAQYSRFAAFNNYALFYSHFQPNNAGIGVQITVPVVDMVHKAKARESAAEASRAMHEADMARDQFLDGRLRTQHATAELSARAEIATLDQQLAQQQLDVMLVQLKTGTGNSAGAQMTPKDEQNSRIAERTKFLTVLDTAFQMRQAQINLLRQTGELESWVKTAAQVQPVDAPKPE
jgi:outer membrane protein TolC